jgi:hypothetical protein
MNKSDPHLGIFTWSCAACCSANTCAMWLDDPDVTGTLPMTVGLLSCRSKIVELYAQDRPILPTNDPRLPTNASQVHVGSPPGLWRDAERHAIGCARVDFGVTAVQVDREHVDRCAARVVRQPVQSRRSVRPPGTCARGCGSLRARCTLETAGAVA